MTDNLHADFIISGYGPIGTKTIARYLIHDDSAEELWTDSVENASFVCGDSDYLFTITENSETSCIYLYQRAEHGFILSDRKEIDGGALCHITYSAVNKALFGACYETGTIFSVSVIGHHFGELLYQEVQKADEPDALTRAHCVQLNRDETELITVNIALDRLYFYEVRKGVLNIRQILQLPKGIGPRHVLLSEDERLLYIITEYSNEILIYENGREKTLLQRISTLTENFSGISNCSTLCFSKDYRFLYAANRGAQTIALFTVSTTGTLSRSGEYPCGGEHPRHMLITKDGNYLAVCNQNSDNVSVFSLDRNSGALKKQMIVVGFMAPSGILEC